MDSFMRAMVEGGRGRRHEEEDTRDPQAMIMDLKEVFKAFEKATTKGCRFAPGDIVTPLAGYNTRGAGRPHVVLSVLPVQEVVPIFTSDDEAGSNMFGRQVDMRIVGFTPDGENRVAHWVESFEFETYAEHHQRKSAKADASLRAVDAA